MVSGVRYEVNGMDPAFDVALQGLTHFCCCAYVYHAMNWDTAASKSVWKCEV